MLFKKNCYNWFFTDIEFFIVWKFTLSKIFFNFETKKFTEKSQKGKNVYYNMPNSYTFFFNF